MILDAISNVNLVYIVLYYSVFITTTAIIFVTNLSQMSELA